MGRTARAKGAWPTDTTTALADFQEAIWKLTKYFGDNGRLVGTRTPDLHRVKVAL